MGQLNNTRLCGAMVAHLTPDQKAACSNHVRVNSLFANKANQKPLSILQTLKIKQNVEFSCDLKVSVIIKFGQSGFDRVAETIVDLFSVRRKQTRYLSFTVDALNVNSFR